MATSKKNTGKSTTGSKRSTTANTKTKSNTKASSKVSAKQNVPAEPAYVPSEHDIKIRNEIKLLIALAITVLVFISNFGLLSPLGDYISKFLFGLFGVISYVLPIIVFLGVAFLLSNIKNRKAVVKFVAGVVLCILVSAMIQLIFYGYSDTLSAGDYYSICGDKKSGGGFVGALLVNMLASTVGLVGTYIILLLLIIITLVLMTERSFIGGVKKGSKKVYTHAKDDVTKLKDNVITRVEDKEYEKRKRIHKKIKGVSMQKLEDGDESDEEIHEITGAFSGRLPENAHLYRGHVDVDKLVTPNERHGDAHMEEMTEEHPIRQNSVKGHIPSADIYSSKVVNQQKAIDIEKKEEETFTDDEGFFQPKERIVVSEEAKNVMSRKAFGGAPVSNTTSAGAGLLNTSTAKGNGSATVTTATERNATVGRTSVSTSTKKFKGYTLPSTMLLNKGNGSSSSVNELELRDTAKKLEHILANFGITTEVVDYSRGPSVTRYEIQPEIGTRLANITKLSDDIKLHLAATDIRIEPIPGKSTIGIEVPNEGRDSVLIRELIESSELKKNGSKLAFAAGKDIAGQVIVGDIAKMPHLLVAGTTGSGKSVFTNSIIMSILFRATPDEVRLIIVDPKVVEFGVYNGIPHLLQPVVTDPRLASTTLKWAVAEMSDRYKIFAEYNVRDLKGYNEKIGSAPVEDGEETPKKLPQIVIVIDELADLMMVAAKEVEESICRLAQLARAAGIHLIIATQRPSVNVVTGLIKANIPSRVALMVSSGVDSRTIIDQNGAEKLLGNGDMLFYPSGYVKPVRLQGAFVSDGEVQKVVDFWKEQATEQLYDDSISKYVENQSSQSEGSAAAGGGDGDDGRDEYFFEAAKFVIEKEKASTSMLQRVFKIGFNRAARIMDQMCEAGVIGEEEGTKPRKVLMTLEDLESLK